MNILPFFRKRWVRRTGIVIVSIIAAVVLFLMIFDLSCNAPKGNFEPTTNVNDTPQIEQLKKEFSDYARTEESTYLTLPEWYTVFSYQEYAEFVKTNKPSAFPYFAAIGQFWGSYCFAVGMTEDRYPFNFGNHLMLSVIGVSFTAEYALKGLYENTIGRLTEFDSYTTQEDLYAIEIAHDYGQFIPFDPWYAFPFDERFIGIWTETDMVGKDMLRKWERKFFLSGENGVKTAYAWIIKKGTGAVYGAPPAKDYLWVTNISKAALEAEKSVKIVRPIEDNEYIITILHYQPFTDTVPKLAQQGAQFKDISGNDEIMMTVIAPKEWDSTPDTAVHVYTMPVLIDPNMKRVALVSRVQSLHETITNLQENGIVIEHIYDY